MSRAFDSLFKTPGRTVGSVVGIILIGYIISVVVPYQRNHSYGSHAQLSTEDALVIKGQEVYFQEGCQYCHSQNLRPMGWEVARFADADKYGYFPMPVAMEYAHETPAMRGSARLGPDLSRLASRQDAASIKSFIRGGKEDTLKNRFHAYAYLFEETELQPMFLSWKIRMMMQAGVPFSDPFQKSAFDRLEGQSRGDALIAYLASLGQKRMQFDGAYYR
ncbi:MAG: cbb3-type cytochrome c oxidase subunit II [Leptospirales bacterium]|nr:cbb3-type cytochrome c oxidase subunit II [Leptospirales bacterium]